MPGDDGRKKKRTPTRLNLFLMSRVTTAPARNVRTPIPPPSRVLPPVLARNVTNDFVARSTHMPSPPPANVLPRWAFFPPLSFFSSFFYDRNERCFRDGKATTLRRARTSGISTVVATTAAVIARFRTSARSGRTTSWYACAPPSANPYIYIQGA